jgi:hypothetical protein
LAVVTERFCLGKDEKRGGPRLSIAMLTRKPLAVQCAFSAICPTHGKVTLITDGHHCTSDATVGHEPNEAWQFIAFAVMMDHKSD